MAPGHFAAEQRCCRPVGAHHLAVGIEQQQRLGQGVERALQLGTFAGEPRPALGAEPGHALNRCGELAREHPRRRRALARLALVLD